MEDNPLLRAHFWWAYERLFDVLVIGALAYGEERLQRAGASSPRAHVVLLRQATLQLLADGFAGCPTVQQ